MSYTRREFLRKTSLTGSGLIAVAHSGTALRAAVANVGQIPSRAADTHPLKILILGGTSFLGPHQIAFGLNRGHEISIFTRGRSLPTVHSDLLSHVEQLIGDRGSDLEALRGRTWDVVIDNSGRSATWTRDSATLLKDSAGLYMYISSTGVYYPYLNPPISEKRIPVREIPGGITDVERAEYDYGVMKSSSEREARSIFGEDRTTILRPTYIVGPGDRSNRFPYWPVRMRAGGEVMIPGKPDDPVQFIDVRDLAEFSIRLAERETAGTFNVVGPASHMGMHACVHGMHAAVSSPVTWVSITDYEFLKQHNIYDVVPWILPEGANLGSARTENDSAIAAGLTFRPLADTVRDVLNWWFSSEISLERRQSLTDPEDSLYQRERDIIRAWKSR
jgi:2'-hydroxyisoflavone reductase